MANIYTELESVLKSLPKSDRDYVISSLDEIDSDESRTQFANEVINQYNSNQFEKESKKSSAKTTHIDPTQLILNPLNPQNLGALAQREEAAFAGPLINPQDAFKQFMGGISATQPSPVDPTRLTELGDIDRLQGAPEEHAQKMGLLKSMALPSNLATTFAGSLSKSAVSTSARLLNKLKRLEKISGSGDEYRHLFEILKAESGAGTETLAEGISTFSGVNADSILAGMKHPELLGTKYQKLLSDVATEIGNKAVEAKKINPSSFGLPKKTFFDISDLVINRSATVKNARGQILNTLEKQHSDGRISKPLLIQSVKKFFKSEAISLLDENDKVRPSKKNDEIAKYYNGLLESIDDYFADNTITKNNHLNLKGIRQFSQSIGKKAYKHTIADDQGIVKPDPEVARAGKGLYSSIKSLTGTVYQDIPEYTTALDDYSRLVDVLYQPKSPMSSTQRFAKFLEDLDTKNPLQLKQYETLLDELPNGSELKSIIRNFLDQRAQDVEEIIPALKGQSKQDIQDAILNLISKPPESLTHEEGRAIISLLKTTGMDKWDIVGAKLYHDFSGKANLFKVAAAAGAVGGLGYAAGGEGVGKVAGAAAGIIAFPKATRKLMQFGSPKVTWVSELVQKLGIKKTSKYVTPGSSYLALKQFLQKRER